jgi:hypothetical protein
VKHGVSYTYFNGLHTFQFKVTRAFVVGSFGEDLPVYVAQDASDRTWFEVGGIAGTRLGGKIRLTDGEGKPVVSISRSETTFGHEYKGLAPDGRSAAFRPIFLVPPIERCRRRNAPDTRATCDTMDHSASTGSPLPLLHIVAVDHFRSAVLPKRNARRSALVGVQCPWYADAVPFLVVCRARIASRTPRTGSGTTRPACRSTHGFRNGNSTCARRAASSAALLTSSATRCSVRHPIAHPIGKCGFTRMRGSPNESALPPFSPSRNFPLLFRSLQPPGPSL